MLACVAPSNNSVPTDPEEEKGYAIGKRCMVATLLTESHDSVISPILYDLIIHSIS